MNLPFKFLIFAAANAIGFFSASACYLLAVHTGAIPIADPSFDPSIIRSALSKIMMTWAACGLFSIAGLFLKEKAGLFFLLMPSAVPLIYGLNLLVF